MPLHEYLKTTTQYVPGRFGGNVANVTNDDRGSLVPGVHKPDATNTGPYNFGVTGKPAFTEAYPPSGNTITVPAGSYKGIRYWGIVKASGAVRFDECFFAGPDPDSWDKDGNPGWQGSFGCVQNYGNNPPLMRFYDCTLDPSPWLTSAAPGGARVKLNPYNIGHHGGQAEYYRCEITNVSDAINFIGANGSIAIANAHHFTLQQCWVHKGLYANDLYPPDDGQPHCDCFQTNYGKNALLWGNTMGGPRVSSGYNVWPGNPTSPGQGYNAGDDFWNACLMLKQEKFEPPPTDPRYADRVAIARLENIVIKENWLGGGVCTINIASDIHYDTTGTCYESWEIENNRLLTRGADWGKTMRGYAKGDGGVAYNTGSGYYVLRNPSRYGGTLTGNVNEQTGLAVPIALGG